MCATLAPSIVFAENPPQKVVTGAPTVSVGGQAAATQGDVTNNGNIVTDGSSNVFINGKPAATVGSKTNCGGIIVGGSSNVFVNGKPLASSNSTVTPCAN